MTRTRISTASALAFLAVLIPAVAEATGSITGVGANPSPAAVGAEVTITLAGTGTCQTYVTFGDNQRSARLTQLPATVKHTYAAAGKYVIRALSYRDGTQAPGLSPCGGVADMELTVNPGAKSRVLAPAGKAAIAPSSAISSGALNPMPPTVTKVTPSAASVHAGATVSFTVEATGDCSRSRIDFGDGSPVVEYPILAGKSQPAPTHVYAKGGTFEVKAYGFADPWAKLKAAPKPSDHACGGHATANVTVRSTMAPSSMMQRN